MTDKVYQKQLEKFGIESTRIVEGNPLQKRREENVETMLGIVRMLMNTIEGRHWIYSKLEFCCVFSTPFVAGKPDATAFLCGLQEFGHQLNIEVHQASPNEYCVMLQEAAARALNIAPKAD